VCVSLSLCLCAGVSQFVCASLSLGKFLSVFVSRSVCIAFSMCVSLTVCVCSHCVSRMLGKHSITKLHQAVPSGGADLYPENKNFYIFLR